MLGTNIARDIYVTGLQSAHTMEKQALAIMRPQLEGSEKYPDVTKQLRKHISETEGQIKRLDELLKACDASPSTMADTFLSAFSGMAAMGQAAAGGEVIQNAIANSAFENYEIGAYLSLIATARAAGETAAVPKLEQSLEEERRMAGWLQDHILEVTQRFLSLKSGGEKAKS